MKKIVICLQAALLVAALALPVVGTFYTETQAAAPKCNLDSCPGGNWKCCSIDGVTYFMNQSPY
ncbi:hypothetical protein L0337_18400 [candidate division KSB1 bacterium]|nr:hypothetical protein [candidate division KSB1 bacterium]